MIKNIIFDFGNVLGWTMADRTVSTYIEDEANRQLIRDVVFDTYDWDGLNRGILTDEAMFAKICSKLPEELHIDACSVYDNWTNTATPVHGMLRLVRKLKEKGYHLYLLSNATKTFAERCKLVPWISSVLEGFDGLVFSALVGMAKPDCEIFQYVLNEFSLQAEECLFVDDYQENIDSAKKLGILGYCFDGNAKELENFIFCER